MKNTDKMNRYSRQIIFPPIGVQGQKKLLNSYAVLIGCGALGTVIANNLVRAGVGRLRIIDRDYVELDNLQRQILFDEEDVRKTLPKSMAAKRKLEKINSEVKVEAVVEDINPRNIEGLINRADLVIDATDNFETRFLINDACIKADIPWIYGAVVGSIGMTMNIIPKKTACFSCLGSQLPPPGSTETCDTAGIINAVSGLVACIQSGEALKILLKSPHWSRELVIVDLWDNEYQTVLINRKKDCPACGKLNFIFLNRIESSNVAVLCGRNAIQIIPASKMVISLPEVRKKLEKLGRVTANQFLIRFQLNKKELVIFPEGRALIKGAKDEKEARSLYARFVGT